jgi:hypothetical protein
LDSHWPFIYCVEPGILQYTETRFVSISAKLGICTIVGLKETLVKAKIRTWDTRCVNKCPIEPQNGANANLTNLALIQTTGITVYMCKENASKLRSLV